MKYIYLSVSHIKTFRPKKGTYNVDTLSRDNNVYRQEKIMAHHDVTYLHGVKHMYG